MLPSFQRISFNIFRTIHRHQLRPLVWMNTSSTEQPSNENLETTKNISLKSSTSSKAMKAYLERAQEHEKFMAQENQEFQIGKRHLANMMGEDPNTFTQEDVDNAIAYLFPSGLYEPKARPVMKPPEQIFPKKKVAEFDETGRPFHFLFYTGSPNFYKLLHDVVENINELNRYEDAMLRKQLQPDQTMKLELSGYQWIDKESLETTLVENINEKNYEAFISALERLVNLPYSYRSKDFIFKYTKPLLNPTKNYDIPQLKLDSEGRSYITTYECYRKRAHGHVTLRTGTGQISINGKDLNYFDDIQSREQIMFPLLFTNMLNRLDVEAQIKGGGTSGQAGAIRWGIAWGLRSFIDADMIEKMRLAGLLTRDYRTPERKKPGQEGARRKFTWKKR